MTDNPRLRTRNLIAYGVGDLYGGGSFFLISTFAMFYLVNVVGLSPVLAGLIPGLGKIWDALSDPLMGYISDNTKSRHGRRRVFFLIAVLPVAISFFLIWLPVRLDTQLWTFLYYFFAYLFFYTVSTMTMVPYSALSAEMTLDFRERNRLSGTRMIFSILASLLAGVLAQPIINAFDDPGRGHMAVGLVFGFLFAVPWIFVFLGTWELPRSDAGETKPMGMFRNFGSIFANRTFRLHIGMYICAYASMDVLMSWFKFYVIDYLGRGDIVHLGLGAIVLTELAVLPLYVMLANRRGHGRAYLVGLIIWGCATLIMGIQHPGSPSYLVILNCVLVGAGMSAGVVIPWTVLPFVTDGDELITARKRAGTYAGAMTLIRKLIQGAFVLPLLGLLLRGIGYVVPTAQQIASKTTVQQSDATLALIKAFFIITPLVLITLGLLFASRFRISPSTHGILMREIQRLRTGGHKEDVETQTRRVSEEQNGHRYETLYRQV
jgi:oligogalacturonide transporter